MATPAEHLERFVGTWDPLLAREFRQYDRCLRAKARPPPCGWGQKAVEPYWEELPRWLVERKDHGRRNVSAAFLDTIIWGQTSLFYAVRLQDDLLDRDLPRAPLVLAPLLFLSEADRAYASIIDTKSAFWNHYRLALQTTLSGIARVARLQRDPAAPADELLQCYGSVDTVFSVGSAAVCEQMGMADDIPRVNEFVSELGKVLLALDDAADIDEDLADGRLNYFARILLEGSIAGGTDLSLLAETWRVHARREGFDEITKVLLGCLSRAADAIAPLGLKPAMDLIATTRGEVQNLRSHFKSSIRFVETKSPAWRR